MELPPPLSDDDACLDYLWRRHHSEDGQTARCPSCRTVRRFYRVGGKPAYRCTSCGTYVHPTAGTIFHKSRTPLSVWFRAANLVGDGQSVTASELARELGVSYQTARRMARLIGTNGSGPIRGGSALARGSSEVGPRTGMSPGEIWAFGGDGTAAYGGDGLPALAAQLQNPYGLAVGADGSVFIADTHNHVIRMVDRSGIISTVVGIGVPGYSGDGGPATGARLDSPEAVVVNGDGALLIADTANHVVRSVDTDRTISTVVGTGTPGYSGDFGPAVGTQLNRPRGLLLLGKSFLVADQINHRVRKVDPDGSIRTIAGNGESIMSGDGGPARDAGVVMPRGLAMDRDGNLYIAQAPTIGSPGHSVRKVDPAGIITKFAGLGYAGVVGDEGPATTSLLGKPGAVLIDDDGGVLICEHYNHRVRRVDPWGVIRTVIGTGQPGFTGNGGPASAARLNVPVALAFLPDGDLLIADNENHRIRRVVAPKW